MGVGVTSFRHHTLPTLLPSREGNYITRYPADAYTNVHLLREVHFGNITRTKFFHDRAGRF
jgi:hypothetical protein